MYQPLKADFDGEVKRHKDAYPLGPITNVYAGIDNNTDVLIAEAIVWNDHFEDIAEYLKKRTAENDPVGQSWELYFAESYTDDSGVEWLTDCVFGAACLVSDPAYGSTRTRILSVAENNKEESIMDEKEKTEAESLDEERSQLMMLQNDLAAMWEMLDDMYWKTFEIEDAEAKQNPTASLDGYVTRFNELFSTLQTRANDVGVAMAEKQTTINDLEARLTAIQTELDTLKAEKAQAELDARVAKRESALAEVGITLDENKETILKLDDDAFNLFVSGIKQVQSKIGSKVNAETKINLPEPITNQETDISEVIESHKALYKRGKI